MAYINTAEVWELYDNGYWYRNGTKHVLAPDWGKPKTIYQEIVSARMIGQFTILEDNADDWYHGRGLWAPVTVSATANQSAAATTTPAPKPIPSRCQYGTFKAIHEFRPDQFAHRNADVALEKAVLAAKSLVRQSYRSWPSCHHGGTVNVEPADDKRWSTKHCEYVLDIGFKCDKCG